MPRGDIRVELVPPIRGVRADLPNHKIPDGYLAAGQNVICREGRIFSRPGFSALVSTAPTANRVMGGVYYTDNVQTKRTIIGTTASFHLFDGTVWTNITGSALTGTADNQVRFTVFPLTSSTRVIAVNDVDAPQTYTGSGNFGVLGGSPPIAKSITTAFQRVILGNVTVAGTRQASTLWVSDFQAPTVWNSVNAVSLPDTGDTLVEVKALNTQMFAIYKDRSQWIGIGAANLFPFVFELRDQQVGPVSPGSVVQAEDTHYYIGQDWNIYRFDGNKCTSIGSTVRPLIQTSLDLTNMGRTHGFFDPFRREIWWFWQPYNNATASAGIVYRLPYEDIPGAFSPLQLYGAFLSASFPWSDTQGITWDSLTGTWDTLGQTYPTWDSFPNKSQLGGVVGQSTGQVHRFGTTLGDAGNGIDISFDLPFRPIGGIGENVFVDAIESFYKQTVASENLDIILVKSDTLADAGTALAAQTFNLNAGNRILATYSNQQARYVLVRHRILGAQGLEEWRGGILYGFRRGVV